jgi:hypothetical protein
MVFGEAEMHGNLRVCQSVSPKTGVVGKRHAVRFIALDVELPWTTCHWIATILNGELRGRAMRGVGKLRRRGVAVSVFLLAGLLLAGCNSIDGGPPRLYTVEYEAAVARGRVTAWEDSYYAASPSKFARNEIITARMREIDSYYYAFEGSLIRERQELGFVSSIVSLGLTGAIPLASSLGTKSALGAASTFVQGGTKAFSDEVLFQKTVQVLATQMRAHRAFVASDIIKRMRGQDIDTYPLSMALGDLDEYYAAGTIAGALIEIQKTVGAESKVAEATKANTVEFSFLSNASTEALRICLKRPGARDGLANLFTPRSTSAVGRLLGGGGTETERVDLLTRARAAGVC